MAGRAGLITPARLKLRQEMLLDFGRLADAGSPVMVVPRVIVEDDSTDLKSIEVRYASEDFEGPSEFCCGISNDRRPEDLSMAVAGNSGSWRY